MNNFSKNVKEFRDTNSWTQAELADRLGVSSATVAHWERGKNYPNERTVENLCRIFGISRTELFGEMFDTPRTAEVIDGINYFSFAPTVHKVIDECLNLGEYGDDRQGFLVDCIYRRWNELKKEEAQRMRESQDVLDNDQWGGIEEAKQEILKDRELAKLKREELPKWLKERIKKKTAANKGESDNQS